MKKLLLSMAAVALALTAGATTVCFNPEGNSYPGEAEKVITISGSTASDGLVANDYTVPGALDLKFSVGSNENGNNPGVGTWKHLRVYVKNTVTFTPKEGVTISGIKIKYTEAKYAKAFTCDDNGTFALDGTVGTWTGSSTTPVVLTGTATCRIYYIEVTYTGGMEAVAEPAFSVESSFVAAGTTVALSCETAGAEIRYTTDGSTPDATSTLYSAPIEINGHMVINAIAMKAGAAASNVVTGNYGVLYAPQDALAAEYNFADVTTLDPAQEPIDVQGEIVLNEITLKAGPVALSFDKGTAGTDCRIYNSQGNTTLRVYGGSAVTFTATDAVINNIEFTADPFGLAVDGTEGYIIGSVWSAENAGVETVTFKSTGNSTIASIKISYSKKSDAVADIAVDAAEGEVEYFNLQGVRVAEPAAGLYIRRQGNTVTKVIVK